MAENNGHYRFALQELIKFKVQLLSLQGKVSDAIEYAKDALMPFIEQSL